MNITPSFKQATTLKEALENAGRLWWVEERVNALNEDMVNDQAFLLGAKQGVVEQVDRWSQRDGNIAKFNTRQNAIALFDELVAAKFPPAVEAVEPVEPEPTAKVEVTEWANGIKSGKLVEGGSKSGRVSGKGKGNISEVEQE